MKSSYARSGVPVAPLTVEEFLALNPRAPFPPILQQAMTTTYRAVVEGAMPSFTEILLLPGAAVKLARKGFNVPLRFAPQVDVDVPPSKERVLEVAAQLYRDMLNARYA